jgi:hypothetical protein
MATLVMGTVDEGTKYTVRLTNTSAKQTVLLIVGWVPNHAHIVPNSSTVSVAPSAPPVERKGTVPDADDARRLTIVASLDQGGTAKLDVLQDGQSLVDPADQNLTETTTWEFIVNQVGP